MAVKSKKSTANRAGMLLALALMAYSAVAHADRTEIAGFDVALDLPAHWHGRMTSAAPAGQVARPMYLIEAPNNSDDEGVFCHVMSSVYEHPVSDAAIRDAQTLDDSKKQVLRERVSQMVGVDLKLDQVERARFAEVPAARLHMQGSKQVQNRQADIQLLMWAGSTHVQSVTLQCVAVSANGPDRAKALLQKMTPVLNGMVGSLRFEAKQAQDGTQ